MFIPRRAWPKRVPRVLLTSQGIPAPRGFGADRRRHRRAAPLGQGRVCTVISSERLGTALGSGVSDHLRHHEEVTISRSWSVVVGPVTVERQRLQ